MSRFLRMRLHVIDLCFLQAQLILQWCACSLMLALSLPLHAAYILTRPGRLRLASPEAQEAYVITGASSGIGAALAVKLAARRETASIHLTGRDESRLQAVRRACRAVAAGDLRIHTATVDVVDAEAMRHCILAADETEKANGGRGLTSVIANAGVASAPGSGLASSTPIMATNLMGTLHTITPIVPFFVERGYGQIVIMSSIASFYPGIPFLTAYAASKIAQRSYGESLRAGLEPLGIDVLTICPSYVETPMTEELNGKVSMLTPQKAAAKMVDAITARSRGTIFVPDGVCLPAAFYSVLPMQFRALVCRLVTRFMPHEYIQKPG